MLQCFYFVTTVELSHWNLSPDIGYDVSTIVLFFLEFATCPFATFFLPPVAMYREPSLHDVAEQSPPRKTPKTSSDSPVLQNGKKDAQSKTKTSSS